MSESNEPYEPSPIEIWQQCSDIQATWTPEEELRRRGAKENEWRPPGCDRALLLATPAGLRGRR